MRNRLILALDSFVTEPKLSPTEWDFRSLIHNKPTVLQRQELHAAIRYEYARESDAICKLGEEFAELSDDQVEQRGTLMFPKPGGLQLFTVCPFWNCIFWPKFFPRVAWLRIPQEERTRRVEDYVAAEPPRSLKINEVDHFAEWELPPKTGRIRIGNVENLIVSIDWSMANDSEIVRAFGQWVRKSRPGDIPEPRGDASRQNVEAAYLTRLGVMRLLHYYPFWSAREHALDWELKIPPRQSNALRMRQEVRKDLRGMFGADLLKLAGKFLIPPEELPRSWYTITEQQRGLRGRYPRTA